MAPIVPQPAHVAVLLPSLLLNLRIAAAAAAATRANPITILAREPAGCFGGFRLLLAVPAVPAALLAVFLFFLLLLLLLPVFRFLLDDAAAAFFDFNGDFVAGAAAGFLAAFKRALRISSSSSSEYLDDKIRFPLREIGSSSGVVDPSMRICVQG